MPLLLPRPFGGNPYPGARGQKQSKAQKEAPSSASAGPTAGRYTDVDSSISSRHSQAPALLLCTLWIHKFIASSSATCVRE